MDAYRELTGARLSLEAFKYSIYLNKRSVNQDTDIGELCSDLTLVHVAFRGKKTIIRPKHKIKPVVNAPEVEMQLHAP